MIVLYPVSFIFKNIYIDLNDVLKVKLLSNNSAFDPNRIIIYYKYGKIKRIYFSGSTEYQKLIDELRKYNLEVIVKSHIWK